MDAHTDKIIKSSVANFKLRPEQRYYSGGHYNGEIYESLKSNDYVKTRAILNEWREKTRERIMIVGSI